MAKFELIKTIEARKLNRRSRLPLSGPPTTIPYAALLDQVVRERDDVTFVHLTDLYQCSYKVFSEAARPLDGEPLAGSGDEAPATERAASSPAAAEPAAPPPAGLQWQTLPSSRGVVARARVPGGWLVSLQEGQSLALTYYPDADHKWIGSRL